MWPLCRSGLGKRTTMWRNKPMNSISTRPPHPPLFIYIVTGYHTAICTDINSNQPSNICADAVPLTHNHKNEQHQH